MQVNKNNLGITLLLTLSLISIQSCSRETKKVAPIPTLSNTYYPKHTCSNKPLKPKRPGKASTYKNVETYNITISKYNLSWPPQSIPSSHPSGWCG